MSNPGQGPVQLALRNCTIYNVPSFLHWESHDDPASTKSTVHAETEKCLFVGSSANKEPFVAWNPGDPKSNLPRAAADGTIRWRGSNNIFHRYGSFFSGLDRRKQSALDDWRKLWSQSGPGMARQSDPNFRVWPDGYELQETLARDFQPRFSRIKARGQSIDADIGADHNQIPYALVNTVDCPLSAPEIAAKPRGVPRVLRVHQTDGPHKTLEGAFAAAQHGDIIEIASDGPFIPARDFWQPKSELASAETAVIRSPNLISRCATPMMRDRSLFLTNASSDHSGKEASSSFTSQAHTHFLSKAFTFITSKPKEVPAASPLNWTTNSVDGPIVVSLRRMSTYAEVNKESDLVMSDCSIFGQALYLNLYDAAHEIRMSCRRNPVVQTGGSTFVSLEPSSRLSLIDCDGSDNCISWSDRLVSVSDRGLGLNKLLPGSALTSLPYPEGSSTPKDLHRPFRLKKGQPAAKMGADGGPVGVRFEYLPELRRSCLRSCNRDETGWHYFVEH